MYSYNVHHVGIGVRAPSRGFACLNAVLAFGFFDERRRAAGYSHRLCVIPRAHGGSSILVLHRNYII